MGPICTRVRNVIRSRLDLDLPLDGRELRAVAQALQDMAPGSRVAERYVYAELSDADAMDDCEQASATLRRLPWLLRGRQAA